MRHVNKTYGIFDVFDGLKDPRGANRRKIEMKDAVASSFIMLLAGYPSMNNFYNAPIGMPRRVLAKCGLSASQCRMPRRDQAERILAMTDTTVFQDKMWDMAKTAARTGVFRDNKVDGLTIALADGIVVHTTRKKGKGPSSGLEESRRCPHCQEAEYKSGIIESSHKAVVLMVPCIGDTGCVVLNFEMLRGSDPVNKSEGELTGGRHLVEAPGRHLPGVIDIIAGDALYANAPMLNAVKAVGAAGIMRIKGDNRKAIQEADARFDHGRGQSVSFIGQNRKGQYVAVTAWFDDDFKMEGYDEPVRLVKFTEVPITASGELDLRAGRDGKPLREVQTFYLLCTDPDIAIETIWRTGHIRWDIEDSCFHVLSERSNIKHMYSHKACSQILALMLLAFNCRELYLFRFRARDFVGKGITQLEFSQRLQKDIEALPPLRIMLDDSS